MVVETKIEHLDFLAGETLLIDKPLNWTSFDVVNKIRSLLGKYLKLKKIKVGHAGTLDPLASGLLIVCTGKDTKKMQRFQQLDKGYEGVFMLGATTPSYDLETEINQTFPTEHITEPMITTVAESFVGEINQIPPAFSAKHIKGKRAYINARKGIDVIMQPQLVAIKRFQINRIELPQVHFSVTCSKGTYIRSLAVDFGAALKSGAYLASLKRTAIGDFNLTSAISLEDLEHMIRALPLQPE